MPFNKKKSLTEPRIPDSVCVVVVVVTRGSRGGAEVGLFLRSSLYFIGNTICVPGLCGLEGV